MSAAAPEGRVSAGRPRLLIHPKMPGSRAMAVDEALALSSGPATARLYGFSPPTLSVGRLQRIKDTLDAGALRRDGVGLVRRPTGGHAVLHDDELTYSVAMSKMDAERIIGSYRKREVYAYIAGILLRGLEILGIHACVNTAQKGDVRNPDCFGATGEYEISSAGGAKLIGSAQMTTRISVLQQGSIPLSSLAGRVGIYIHEEAPVESERSSSLSEEAGRPLLFEEVRDAFAQAFRERMGSEDGSLTPQEELAVEDLVSTKYAADAWNVMY